MDPEDELLPDVPSDPWREELLPDWPGCCDELLEPIELPVAPDAPEVPLAPEAPLD